MLLVLRQLAFTDMSKTIVFVMLREVETDFLTIGRNTHRDKMIDKLITQPTHGEGIDEHYDDCQQMEQEYHKTLPRASDETFLYEDTCQYGTENTTCTVRREYVECIVNTGV